MKEVISKELLSEVLECDCSKVVHKENTIDYIYDYDVTWSEHIQYQSETINIYELAYECKEWAFHRGVSVYCVQYKIDKGEYCVYIYDIHEETEILDTGVDDMTFATESEAIFKVCEWIYDKQK